jgi:tetratricopeptide (TPR) repeat protein
MKTSLVAIVITFAGIVSGQQATAQPQTQPAAPAQTAPSAQTQPTSPAQTTAAPAQTPAAPAQPQQKKEIKDPAEYNAYVGAIQQTDPTAQISGLEAFLAQYPNSVMKEDALETLMVAYQKTNNQAKMLDAAQRILQANPNNLRALALLAYIKRAQAEAGQDAQNNLTQGAQYADRGLQALQTAPKPDGTSDADFNKMKMQMSAIFNGTSGMAALQAKNYPQAQQRLKAAVQADPNDLRNVYPLALADLTGTPPNSVEGLYFIARAAVLAAGQPSQAQIESYGKSQYTKYHGSDQGWTDVEAQAKTNPMPPAGFTITQYVPPTPAQQAADLVKTKTPKDMSFAEWELVLSAGQQADADKVWSVIKGVPLQMEGTVIKATPTELQIAASQDDIDQKRADVIVTMGGTIPARLMPQEGATLDFEGTPVSYTPSPFIMTMEKGALLTKAAPAKKPVHHRPSTQQ